MELRRLALLRELSRRGTIAAVAQALSYSHSSVSVQLAELEKEAGTPLLRRVGRNVELTAAGLRLAAHADQALAADEAVRTELAALADVPHGRIRMTFVQTPAIALLPGTLERLAASAPQVEVDVIQRETAPALEDLRSHAVELVLGIEYDPLPVGRRRDDYREDLLREDVLVTLHRDHPAAAQPGPVRLASLQDATWATGHHGTGIDAFLRNACNRLAGYDPKIRHRSDDAIVLSAIVGSRRAVTLLPALFAAGTPGLTARPTQEGALQRTIFTVTRRTARDAPAIRAVRQALRDTATQVAASRDGLEVLPVPPASQVTANTAS
jgi:DNA-binding transcriptional LysR family regulator